MLASEVHEGEEPGEGGASPEGAALHPWVLHMDRRGRSFNGRQRNRTFMGVGGARFEDLSLLLGADSSLDGRAAVVADLDGDGDEDLFIHNLQRERHQLWRNDLGDPERALVIELQGAGGLRDPVGAVVTVAAAEGAEAQAQALQRGAGFLTSQGPRLHFGISGEATLRVRWPGGEEETFGAVTAPARVRLVQGSGEAVQLPPIGGRLRDPWPQGLRLPVGAKLPVLRLERASGAVEELRLDEPVVLHFWSSACAACVSGLAAAVRSEPGEPRVVPICVDPGARRAQAVRLLALAGAEDSAWFAPLDPSLTEGSLGEVLDLTRLPVPTDLVLGPGGELVEVRSALK